MDDNEAVLCDEIEEAVRAIQAAFPPRPKFRVRKIKSN